jgi:hypothetical protein
MTLRGHGPKIHKAVEALEACGKLPHHLRPVRRDQLICDWLKANGYEADLPTRSALARFFANGRCNAGKSVRSVSVEMSA